MIILFSSEHNPLGITTSRTKCFIGRKKREEKTHGVSHSVSVVCSKWESIDIKAPRLKEIASKVDDNDHNRNSIFGAESQKWRGEQSWEKKRSGRNDKTKNILIIRLCVVIQLITQCRIQHSGFSPFFCSFCSHPMLLLSLPSSFSTEFVSVFTVGARFSHLISVCTRSLFSNTISWNFDCVQVQSHIQTPSSVHSSKSSGYNSLSVGVENWYRTNGCINHRRVHNSCFNYILTSEELMCFVWTFHCCWRHHQKMGN